VGEGTVQAEANTDRTGRERVCALLGLIHSRVVFDLIVVMRFGTEHSTAGSPLLALVWEVVPLGAFSEHRHTAELGSTVRVQTDWVLALAQLNVVFKQVAAMVRLLTSVILVRSLQPIRNLKRSSHTYAPSPAGKNSRFPILRRKG